MLDTYLYMKFTQVDALCLFGYTCYCCCLVVRPGLNLKKVLWFKAFRYETTAASLGLLFFGQTVACWVGIGRRTTTIPHRTRLVNAFPTRSEMVTTNGAHKSGFPERLDSHSLFASTLKAFPRARARVPLVRYRVCWIWVSCSHILRNHSFDPWIHSLFYDLDLLCTAKVFDMIWVWYVFCLWFFWQDRNIFYSSLMSYCLRIIFYFLFKICTNKLKPIFFWLISHPRV